MSETNGLKRLIHQGEPSFDAITQGKTIANFAAAIEMGYIIAGVEYDTKEVMEKAFELYLQLMPRGYTVAPGGKTELRGL